MEGEYGKLGKRVSTKSQSAFDYSIWKHKLRECCFRRVRKDRNRLLWKLRLSGCQSSEEKEIIASAFQDIVSDELKKMEDSSRNLSPIPTLSPDFDDMLWEYHGLKDAYQGDSEEILLEMQHIFYKDLISDPTINDSHVQIETWDAEEDDYLATLVSQNMLLNTEQDHKKQIWCPICKRGELIENHLHIYCNMCEMQLTKGHEINLNILEQRLAEAHAEHLERGCRLKPKFSVQRRYNLKALYITCEACNTFEIII